MLIFWFITLGMLLVIANLALKISQIASSIRYMNDRIDEIEKRVGRL